MDREQEVPSTRRLGSSAMLRGYFVGWTDNAKAMGGFVPGLRVAFTAIVKARRRETRRCIPKVFAWRTSKA